MLCPMLYVLGSSPCGSVGALGMTSNPLNQLLLGVENHFVVLVRQKTGNRACANCPWENASRSYYEKLVYVERTYCESQEHSQCLVALVLVLTFRGERRGSTVSVNIV